MPDSSLKTILGVAAVGAAGIGAVYLLNKKTIDSAFGQIGEALGGVGQALGDFGSGIQQGFNDFSKSLGDFGSGISQGYEDLSKKIGDYNSSLDKTVKDLTSSNKQQQQILTEQAQTIKNVTDYAGPGGAVTLLADALGNGLQGIIDWINGGGGQQTIVNVAVNDKDELRRAADDATQIATVTTTPTPITEVKTTASQTLINKYGLTESGNLNFGQGRKVTGIQSNNKFVGEILKSYGFSVDDSSYV